MKYLIVGSITKFGLEQKKQGIGGGGFGHGGFGLGNIGREKGKANVAITARMVDVTSAEIMASAKGEGVSSRSRLLLGGGAGGGGGAGFGGVSMTSSDYQDTILGEATETAVKQVAENSSRPGPGSTTHDHMTSPPRLAYLAWAAICIIWGTTYLAIRVASPRCRPRSWAASDGLSRRSCWLPSSTPGASGCQDLTRGVTSPCRACSCSASATAA